MRKIIKIVILICATYLVLSIVGGIVLAEGSLRLRHRPLSHRQQAEALVRQEFQTDLQEVSMNASDSVVLKGWHVHPRNFNGNAVVLAHGITDNREGVGGYAAMFLKHGYAVLLPDARAHGESGGELATYGVKEADDLHRWVSWLYAHDYPQCVYGFGESYGAALMLQSLAAEPRYCAVAVEDSFSTAREMSYERVSGFLHLGSWFGKTLGRPIHSVSGLLLPDAVRNRSARAQPVGGNQALFSACFIDPWRAGSFYQSTPFNHPGKSRARPCAALARAQRLAHGRMECGT